MDISLFEEYATLCSMTKKEIVACYEPEIKALAERQGMRWEECLVTLRAYYGGYHFSESDEVVYNPGGLLSALFSKRFLPYWYSMGTPDFLIKRLKSIGYDTKKFKKEKLYVSKSLLSGFADGSVNPLAVLYQTGYLTIKEYDSKRNRYLLGFPNKDVEEGFFACLMPEHIPF